MSYNLKYTSKEERQRKETEALFKNPRYAREAWKSVGIAILNSPAQAPIDMEDPTLDNLIEHYSFNSLCKDVATIVEGDRKEPTELEMIFRCQAIHARHNTNAAVFVRDTVGGKPVDESKVEQTNVNMFEQLSDDELEMLIAYREKKEEEAAAAQRDAATAISDLVEQDATLYSADIQHDGGENNG